MSSLVEIAIKVRKISRSVISNCNITGNTYTNWLFKIPVAKLKLYYKLKNNECGEEKFTEEMLRYCSLFAIKLKLNYFKLLLLIQTQMLFFIQLQFISLS